MDNRGFIEKMKREMTSLNSIKRGIQYFKMQQSLFFLPFRILMIMLQYVSSRILYVFVEKDKSKDKKIVVGFSNIYYTGNPRAVFEYMLQHPDKYEVFWAAKNLRSIKDVKKAGGKVFYIYGLLGIPYFLKADAWMLAHTGMGNIPFLPHKNYKLIQTWHGIGPKPIGRKAVDYDPYDIWCVPSTFCKKREIELYGAPEEKLRITGWARLDTLYEYLKLPKQELVKNSGIKNSNNKIILYAPTAEIGLWPWGNPYEEFEKLCKFCKENNLTLILRLHPYTYKKVRKTKIKKIIKKYDNVYWIDMPKEPDTMKLLAIADILITDWSSIYTDYFLTNRPIIYLDVEKERFFSKKGKSEIPPEYRAGEIVHNNEEFYEALNIVLREGNRHKEKQEELLKIIHGNVDGKATERVTKVIKELLKN